MTTKYSLLIGIERYLNAGISPVDFAEADAKGFAKVLTLHDFDTTDQTILLSQKATKATIESEMRSVCKHLKEKDVFILFYAGHGFSTNGHNYMTCSDTRPGDPARTSLSLQEVLAQLRASGCKRVIMFLDSCSSGIEFSEGARALYGGLSQEEIKELLQDAEYCHCFASCKSDEESYSISALKHGCWTYHLIQAFSGKDKSALTEKHLLTSTSLQGYLRRAVPTTLKQHRITRSLQTPWQFGGNTGEFLLANLQELLHKEALANVAPIEPKRAALVRMDSQRVKALSGYKKGHHVPEEVADYAAAFIRRIAADDIDNDLTEMVKAFRDKLGYKNKELQRDGAEDGTASIVTPDFDFHIAADQSSDDPGECTWRYEVTHIREPSIIARDDFNEVFSDYFDALEVQTKQRLDVAEIVNRLEEDEPERIEYDYDPSAGGPNWCEVRSEGSDAYFRIDENGLRFESGIRLSPKPLLSALDKHLKLVAPALPPSTLKLLKE